MAIFPDDAALHEFVSNSERKHTASGSLSDTFDFDQYLTAAKAVRAAESLLTCKDIHKLVTVNTSGYQGNSGEYRDRTALIGFRSLPRPFAVAELMHHWQKDVDRNLIWLDDKRILKVVGGMGLNRLYDNALCVHPYSDGNGRTFRLLLNHWRQSCGLPWMLFTDEEWSTSLRRLQLYEANVFRRKYAWAYR